MTVDKMFVSEEYSVYKVFSEIRDIISDTLDIFGFNMS